jgi:hypothetical protein
MIYRLSNSYRHYILLGVIYFGLFAYSIENSRDFFSWLWLLGSILNFMAAIRYTIKSNKMTHTDDEIIAIGEFIQEKADHRGWENAEYYAIEKFGEEKTKKALEYLKSKKNG